MMERACLTGLTVEESVVQGAWPTGQKITIAPGETVEIPALFWWQLPDNPPPMLAVVKARFHLFYRGSERMRTPPYTFLLGSRQGDFDAMVGPANESADQARAMLSELSEFEGVTSDGFKTLRGNLQAKAQTNVNDSI